MAYATFFCNIVSNYICFSLWSRSTEKWQRGVLKLKKCGQPQVLLAVGVILWLLLGFTQIFRIYFSVLYLTVFILLCDQVRQKNIM